MQKSVDRLGESSLVRVRRERKFRTDQMFTLLLLSSGCRRSTVNLSELIKSSRRIKLSKMYRNSWPNRRENLPKLWIETDCSGGVLKCRRSPFFAYGGCERQDSTCCRPRWKAFAKFSFFFFWISDFSNFFFFGRGRDVRNPRRSPEIAFLVEFQLISDTRSCHTCDKVLEELEKIDDDTDNFGVDLVKINDKRLAKQYGIKNFPALTYFREKEPIIYDGSGRN